jgi:hypothetical protein
MINHWFSWKVSLLFILDFLHAGGRTDGRTDTTKLIVAFRNFARAPKNVFYNLALTAEMNPFMNSARVSLP